jgi:hypothetical protein
MPNDLLGLTGAGSASLASSQATLGGTHDLPKAGLLLVLVVVLVGVDHVPAPRSIEGPARGVDPGSGRIASTRKEPKGLTSILR